jgi:formate dehydrogenase subunit delta
MKRDDLVRMANQITDYFSVYPEAEALNGIAKHIHNTWERRMRDELKSIVEDGGEGMKPLCVLALRAYFNGPNAVGKKVRVDPSKKAPEGAAPSFADGGGDAG